MRRLVRVVAGSRIHLGFYSFRLFGVRLGSLGLYIQRPRTVVEASATSSGPLLEGVPEELRPLVTRVLLKTCGERSGDVGLRVVEHPPLHVGLGSTTQVALSVGTAVSAICAGRAPPAVDELVTLTQRGRYSGVGIHAFLRGGFVVDGGKTDDLPYPPLLMRLSFPEEWSVILVMPKEGRGLSDEEEKRVMDPLPEVVEEQKSLRLVGLAFMKVVRGVATGDFERFSTGLSELQIAVGEVFSQYQGGVFSSFFTKDAVDALRASGFRGVGQSSWGPTAYGFYPSEHVSERLRSLKRELKERGLEAIVLVTRARNRGFSLVTP